MLSTIAVLGSGDLAATALRRLAEAEMSRRVVLVSDDASRARGQALDIAQSAPLEGFDVVLEGRARLSDVGVLDALLVADGPAPGQERSEWAQRIRNASPRLVVLAGLDSAALLESLVSLGQKRESAVGSGPLALAAALRWRLGQELGASPRDVHAGLMGAFPSDLVVPRSGATLGGVPVDDLSPLALRRAVAGMAAAPPGPVALAAAAVRVLAALVDSSVSVLPVLAMLAGEYGLRGVALAVPARLGGGRLADVLEAPLSGVERVAFGNAGARRSAAAARSE